MMNLTDHQKFYYIDSCRGDEVVQLLANLVCQLKGTEASVAIDKIMATHARIENHIKTQGVRAAMVLAGLQL